MRILLISHEVAPLARVGGLSDVAAALPAALRRLGHDVRVLMPWYPIVESNPAQRFDTEIEVLEVPTNYPRPFETASVLTTTLDGDVPVYLIRHDRYFANARRSSEVYPQPLEAIAFFARAVFSWLQVTVWQPDVLHCNDWQTGLIPALLVNDYRAAVHFGKLTSVFTIHNLAYQGLFEREALDVIGLPQSLFTPSGVEFYGRVNLLKAGLVFSDLVNTVSPRYAKEILTPEFGCGLEGVLQELADRGRLSGILNGIDTIRYDPATDPNIAAQYRDRAGKQASRSALQKQCGLALQNDAPLIGIIGRLVSQKGLDLLPPIMESLIERGFQFVILGQGDRAIEQMLAALGNRYPRSVHVRVGFEELLGQQIYAGADAFLMPSRFEPCGLGQLIAMRYGALPIVRRTGGLADTVADDDSVNAASTGFVFEGTATETLLEVMKRVRAVFRDESRWDEMTANALRADFSWESSARSYAMLFEDAVSRSRP